MKSHASGVSSNHWFAARIAIGCLATILTLRASHAETIAASNVPDAYQYSGFFTSIGYASNTNGGFANTAVSQRFVPDQSGPLSKLLLYVRERVGAVPFKIAIRSDQGGLPGALLGEKSFSASQIPAGYSPPDGPTLLDMASLGVILSAGSTYHAVFRTDSPIWGDSQYHMHIVRPHGGSFGLPYLHSRNGGATWPSSGSLYGLEVPLKAIVVPEPSSALLAIVAAACFASRRYTRRRC